MSLRTVAKELAAAGLLNERGRLFNQRGRLFNQRSIKMMIEG
jgi:hypothetical protein